MILLLQFDTLIISRGTSLCCYWLCLMSIPCTYTALAPLGWIAASAGLDICFALSIYKHAVLIASCQPLYSLHQQVCRCVLLEASPQVWSGHPHQHAGAFVVTESIRS